MSKKTEGIRIDHNYDELESGSSYIMVVKDTPLIDHSKGMLVETQTELENIDLQASHKQKIKLQLRRGTEYDPYRNAMEEKEFGLYDQINHTKVLYWFFNLVSKEGIDLDERGQYDPSKVAQLEAIKQKLSKVKANEISLETPKVFASEYEVPEPVKVKRKTAMQKRRKPENEDILGYLDKESKSDLGMKEDSRKKQEEEARTKESLEQADKSEKYKGALKRAKKITADVYAEKDEYDEIEAALNRQRLALQSKEVSKRGEDAVHELIKGEATETVKSNEDSGVMLTDSLNFINAVASIKDRKEHKKNVIQNANMSLNDTRDGRTSIVNVPLPTERLRYLSSGYNSSVVQQTETTMPEISEQKISTIPVVVEETDEKKPMDELLIGKGVGNAIKVLRERKLLGQSYYFGRTKDPTKEKELEKFAKAGSKSGSKVDFDYRDASGHKLTLKEIWREQCRIFHGIKPSKKRQEKTILKREKELKKLSMDQAKDSKLSQALTKTQHEKNVPYMVLDAKKTVIF